METRWKSALTIAATLALADLALSQASSLAALEREEIRGSFTVPSSHRFGRDVLLDGDTALAMYGSTTSSYLLQCFVFGGGAWSFQSAPPLGASRFTMSFEGNLLLLGFFGAGSTSSGRVGVARRGAFGAWTYTWLDAPDPNAGPEFFGTATDVDGTTVVISNYVHTQSYSQEGAIYVYEDTGASLVLRQSFYGGANDVKLGSDVSLDGDDLLASFRATATTFGVRAYSRLAGTWVETQTSVLSTPLASGKVELDSGSAIVRVGGGDFLALANTGAGWFVESALPQPSTADVPNDFAISDGVIAVGFPEDDTATADAGAVRLYARNDGWKLQATVSASDPGSTDYLGYGLDLQGDRLLVGAPNHDHFGNDEGVVYAFDLVHSPARVYCVPELTSLGCVAHIGFQGTPSASGSSPFTINASNVLSHRTGALVYGTGGRVFQPYSGGVRCFAPPRRMAARQSSGGSTAALDCSGALATDFNALVRSGVDPLLFVGVLVEAQWFFRDPAGPSALASSEAVEFTIGP